MIQSPIVFLSILFCLFLWQCKAELLMIDHASLFTEIVHSYLPKLYIAIYQLWYIAIYRLHYNSKVELINIKKYETHYPDINEFDKYGYTYVSAELKTHKFDGIEFFCAVRELYKRPDGSLTLTATNDAVREKRNAFEVGLIPYEWIEYIDPLGDEFSYRPQFFVRFMGLQKSPYKYLSYYIESDTYNKASDPMEYRWRKVYLVN